MKQERHVRFRIMASVLVDLMEALSHPCWEAKRLLDMAVKWADQQAIH